MRDSVFLSPIRRYTTRAGFGCAALMGALSKRESLALLHTAWDAGIRYFDVAPLYGHGKAEAVLGEFLRGRRNEATVVTKFGFEPTQSSLLHHALRSVVRPVARRFPTLVRSAKEASPQNVSPARPPFTAQAARISLERSLRALRTESIDVLLVHEAEPNLLNDDGLLTFLEDSVAGGLIRGFGIGGERRRATQVFESHRAYCTFVQCEWSVLDPPPVFPGAQLSVFGVLSGLARHSRSNDVQFENPGCAQIAARAAALMFPEAVVLFSSRNRRHIVSTVNALSDATLDSHAAQLVRCWEPSQKTA